jgi:hypothetical protein
MTKNLAAIFVVALVTASCSHGVSRIQTRSLPSPNPTSWLFPLPVEEVRAKAMDAFSIQQQVSQPVFGRHQIEDHIDGQILAECSTNAVFGEAIFRDPANTNDIYLHSLDSPFVISSVYYGKYGGLPFEAAFHLHLSANGSNTLVSITTLDAQVINGTKFGFGPCGPGQGYNYVPVRPTTIEEYSILRYLGAFLGVTNMPAVKLPTP